MSTTTGRKDLSAAAGGRLWRSLDELAGTPAFAEMLHREFPDAASEWTDGQSRRNFLKLMGASLALAGLAGSGCTKKPEEKIVPYVRQPEELIPGKPLYFASAIFFGGYARGVLVESHEGRPTKIEGNPDHPASLGAADAVTQAALLNLYDPDRSQTVTRNGEVSTWNTFTAEIGDRLTNLHSVEHGDGGEGLRILTGAVTSPTQFAQIRSFLDKYPKARWEQYEPIGRDNAKLGAKLATGQDVQAVFRFDRAKVVVSLDSNFLLDDPGSIRYARQFIDGRRVRADRQEMNRLYVAEATPTIAGAMADECIRVKPSRIEAMARALLAAVTGTSSVLESDGGTWVAAVARDLSANRGAGLVVAGEGQPPAVHAMAHAINAQLGNVGKTVDFIEIPEAAPVQKLDSLKTLVNDMYFGLVKTLIMLGGNPVYTAPADLNFVDAMRKVPVCVHHASHIDETSFYCQWHLPVTHELEMWSDGRAYDGTACLVQPLIAPLYQGRSPHEVLAILNGQYAQSGYEIVREYWRNISPRANFELWWDKCLNDGVIAGSTPLPKDVTINPRMVAATTEPAATTQATAAAGGGLEVAYRPDPHIRDGRHANNGWLQEVPKPLTRLSWGNAALMSAKTASGLGVIDIDNASGNDVEATIIRLTLNGRTVEAPAWILPGQPDDVITVHLGFGRTRAGGVGNGVGFNAYAIRTTDALWNASGATVTLTDRTMPMACVQNHSMMDQNFGGVERELVKVIDIQHAAKTPEGEKKSVSLSLYPEHPYASSPTQGNKWGMVIDQNACIGCNACVVACVAENNIPVVGKEQVAKGREMHWIRIDNYFSGEEKNPAGPYFQPVPCMHCENAPCEVVCPVNATVHDAEGLNEMVYNRCIGTRYCSNNCPYKVRHFNFLHYTEAITPESPLALMMNPNVTVRYRGVMEKCTYCVQRINSARIESKIEFVNKKRETDAIRDGEVVPACAQSCPTQAIIFGNVNDKQAQVAKLKAEPENYGLLDELQTKPRTTYLPRYVNRGTGDSPVSS